MSHCLRMKRYVVASLSPRETGFEPNNPVTCLRLGWVRSCSTNPSASSAFCSVLGRIASASPWALPVASPLAFLRLLSASISCSLARSIPCGITKRASRPIAFNRHLDAANLNRAERLLGAVDFLKDELASVRVVGRKRGLVLVARCLEHRVVHRTLSGIAILTSHRAANGTQQGADRSSVCVRDKAADASLEAVARINLRWRARGLVRRDCCRRADISVGIAESYFA